MTNEDGLHPLADQHAVDALLAEAGFTDDAELRELLLQLRSFRTDEVPPPSAEVAALMAAPGAAPVARFDPARPRRKRRFVFTALGVAASLGVAGGAAAVNGDLRREAEGTINSILWSFSPPESPGPAPAPAPAAPTRPAAVAPAPAGHAPAATMPAASLPEADPQSTAVPGPPDAPGGTREDADVKGPAADASAPEWVGDGPAPRTTVAPQPAGQADPGNADGAKGGQGSAKAEAPEQEAGAADTHGTGAMRSTEGPGR
ncbi:hypothetical protein [Arthrobacter sp. C152]